MVSIQIIGRQRYSLVLAYPVEIQSPVAQQRGSTGVYNIYIICGGKVQAHTSRFQRDQEPCIVVLETDGFFPVGG